MWTILSYQFEERCDLCRLPQVRLVGEYPMVCSSNLNAKKVRAMARVLLWTVLFSCAATFVMINSYGRYTLVTGETAHSQ